MKVTPNYRSIGYPHPHVRVKGIVFDIRIRGCDNISISIHKEDDINICFQTSPHKINADVTDVQH